MKKRSQDIGQKEKPTQIRRGRVVSIDLYEVKENELNILEKGGPTNIYLNFSIFLLSMGFTSIATLFTATFVTPIFQIIFVVIAVVGILAGILLLFLWKQGKKSISATIEIIKDRIKPTKYESDDYSENGMDYSEIDEVFSEGGEDNDIVEPDSPTGGNPLF